MNYYLSNKFRSKIFYFILCILILVIFLIFLQYFSPTYFNLVVNFSEEGAIIRNYSKEFSGWYETGNNIFLNSFKYLLYPLFDFSTLNKIIISSENILILFFVLKASLNYDKKLFNKLIKKKLIIFSILFFTIMLVTLSNFTANMGISARQKWMMMPFLFIFLVPFLNKHKFYK